MLIAADVGGTNSRFGLFARATARPLPVATREYGTQRHASFEDVLATFIRDMDAPQVDAIAVAVAGPVIGQRARLTNVAWDVSAEAIGAGTGVGHVRLLNDLEALATSLEVLTSDEWDTLQEGHVDPEGNMAVIAPGTGLGEAYLPRLGGRVSVLASEAGHADFAARTDQELDLVRMLRAEFGRATVEHVLSGPGLQNLHRFTHRDGTPCGAVPDAQHPTAAAAISRSGLDGRCRRCVEALSMFVEALGAEAGNLGLRGTATGGVYLGGGIAPAILPALRGPSFLAAFRDKAPMEALVQRMPVRVILNRDAGLLGAAVAASRLGA
jgi:glucokinase